MLVKKWVRFVWLAHARAHVAQGIYPVTQDIDSDSGLYSHSGTIVPLWAIPIRQINLTL